jgi:hypothetical protein
MNKSRRSCLSKLRDAGKYQSRIPRAWSMSFSGPPCPEKAPESQRIVQDADDMAMNTLGYFFKYAGFLKWGYWVPQNGWFMMVYFMENHSYSYRQLPIVL